MKKIIHLIRQHPARTGLFFACAVCLIASLILFGRVHSLSRSLLSQQAAERWEGDSGQTFGQVTCLFPNDEKKSVSDIYTLRTGFIKNLQDASLDTSDASLQLWEDCWSTTGTATVSSSLGNGKVNVTAVGENFFNFHPLTLLNGSYITPDDFMGDRVLLDENTAWLLFGSYEVEGLTVTIDEQLFVVAGVIQPESDAATQIAYDEAFTTGRGIYMSYDAWLSLNTAEDGSTTVGITCYEVVLAEPVTGFAYTALTELLKDTTAVIIPNSSRFGTSELFDVIKAYGTRSMQSNAVAYPYWENAARCVEDRCALALVVALILLILPVCTAITCAVVYGRRGLETLNEDIIPKHKERVEEKLRARERKAWERRHPGMK